MCKWILVAQDRVIQGSPVVHPFTWLSCILWHADTKICFSVHLFMEIWVISGLWILQIKLYEHSHKSLQKDVSYHSSWVAVSGWEG